MESRAVSYRGGRAPCASVLLGVVVLALSSGCREQGSSDQATRPLPAPEPPAAAAQPLPRDDVGSAPKKRAASDEADTAAKPTRPSNDSDGAQAPSGAATPVGAVAPTSPGSPDPAGAAAPASPSSAPAVGAPSAACVSRCQGAMQGCLSTPVDAGVPGFGNLELCKKAFEACQSACSKQ